MTTEDYDRVVDLWRNTDGIVLSDTDERGPMQRFLNRNPGLSLVAEHGDKIIGAVLCSHDGRRGYLHHLAVGTDWRRRGIGSALVQRSVDLLSREAIVKCNVFILESNEAGIAFWEHNGFSLLPHFGWMQTSLEQMRDGERGPADRLDHQATELPVARESRPKRQ
jgi:putative acetyltransferase